MSHGHEQIVYSPLEAKAKDYTLSLDHMHCRKCRPMRRCGREASVLADAATESMRDQRWNAKVYLQLLGAHALFRAASGHEH